MYKSFGHRLPQALSKPLFGDRRRFGQIADRGDPDWLEWNSRQYEFYLTSQRTPVALAINDAGYRVMREVDLSSANVLEVGPADIRHLRYWTGRPRKFTSIDFRRNLLEIAGDRLRQEEIAHEEVVVDPDDRRLPFPADSFDVAISFYALEHFHPLQVHLAELKRVLRPGGVLVGAVPCEGGLAWGLGRYLTTRRWLHRNTGVSMDKIICWEHPNFADTVLNGLGQNFTRQKVRFWPSMVPMIDANLIASFVFRKAAGKDAN